MSDKLGEVFILSLDKLIPKEQGFDEAAEIIIDRIEIAITGVVGLCFDWSFRK
jgi:hypothetical protein